MALVGVIEAGDVTRILRSVRHAKGDVLVLFERGDQSGHVLFERGEVVTARLDELKDEQALAALEQWDSGHYSLLKRARKDVEASGHALLCGLNLTTRRGLERWLKRSGWAASIVGYPQQAEQVVAYIQPEVVLMHCPRLTMGVPCSAVVERFRDKLKVPPLLVVVEGEDRRCPDPEEGCVRITADAAALERVLVGQSWPGTRYGVRQASEERTARIHRPQPLPPAARAADAPEAGLPEEVRVADLLPMLVTLLLGSGLIWGLWFLATV